MKIEKKKEKKSLVVEVVEGKGILPPQSSIDPTTTNCDPYVIVSIGKEKYKTKVVRETSNPNWDIGSMKEIFTFKNKSWVGKEEIVFKCMDWDRFKVEDRLGVVIIPIKQVEEGELDDWFSLKPQRPGDIAVGQLHIRCKIISSTKERYSDLWKAIRKGDNEIVKKIISSLPTVNFKESDPVTGETLLHLAAKNSKSTDTFELLLSKGISVTTTDNEGNTPLHTFCRHFAYPSDFLDKFIAKGAQINAQNRHGETPLHHVVFNPSVKLLMAQQLLKRNGDINICTTKKDTPLHYAIEIGRTDLVKLFISHGADCNLAGSKGKLPIALARQLGFSKLADLITDSLAVMHCLKKLGLERHLHDILDQEIYLYHLEDIPDYLLMKLVNNKEDMDKIRVAARDYNSRSLNRKETFLRKQETELRKREELRKKESNVRNIIAHSLPNSASENWEIDLSDLDFVASLGHGASGSVYKGFYQGTIPVAIKLLKSAQSDTEKEMNEFIKEFRVAMTINSQHIVRFFGATLRDRLCLVMEFCEKGSLFSVLSSQKDLELDWELVFSMLEETVQGICALHNFDPPILHRDLKTLNVLVTADYKCKVCDFGLSRFATEAETLIHCRGTLAYVAPEVYKEKGFFPQSDVYSLAIMMWEVVYRAITGQYLRPYHDIKIEFSILRQAHERGRRPQLPDTLPISFRDVIVRCWEPDYLTRPDASQLLDLLRQLRSEYNENKLAWDKVCFATKNSTIIAEPVPAISLPTVLPNDNGIPSIRTARTDRPQLRHGGGGSVNKSAALAALGVNVNV